MTTHARPEHLDENRRYDELTLRLTRFDGRVGYAASADASAW